MAEVSSAIIYLDDDKPEYLEGVERVGSVQLFDVDGELINDDITSNKLVDNKEFHDLEDMINNVANRLGIEKDNITIE